MSIDAAVLRKATQAVMGPLLRDWKRGGLVIGIDQDEDEFVRRMVERRKTEIAAVYADMLRGEKKLGACADCGAPSTATKAGRPYCAAHAARHTLERPKK